MEKLTFTIDGMMCGMCESHVCDAIRKVCGDKTKVTASHSAGTAQVIGEGLDAEKIKAAVEQTGYRVLNTASEPCEKKKKFSLFG
ncbi:MAG: cation transporter [Oscillospiraceae bacterium]|nr:cation transporter [Oscillospiraceae bacterium]